MALETSILHCLFDTEPTGYHPADPAAKRLAVNLGFEPVTDVSVADIADTGHAGNLKRVELAVDESAAVRRFERFVTDTESVQFHIFEATVADKTCTLDTAHKLVPCTSDSAAPDAAAALAAWLAKAAPETLGTRHYWTTPKAAVAAAEDAPAEITVEATTAAATWRLRAAHSWNAPVAHRLGLTHILTRDSEPERYVVLPFFTTPGDPLPDIQGVLYATSSKDATSQKKLWDFTYDAGGKSGKITCRTEVLNAAAIVDPEAVSDFLTGDGYLKVDGDAENLWRVTKWFEARAASLMSPAAALTDLGADTKETFEKASNALFPWHYGSEKECVLTAQAPAWLAVSNLCASLDNIVLGVLQPGPSKTPVIGDILAPLTFDLFDQFQATIAGPFNLTPAQCGLETLITALRNTLKQSALMKPGQDFNIPATRESVCDSLRRVHDIAPSTPDMPVDVQLLDLLLKAFEEGKGQTLDRKLWLAIKGEKEGNGPMLLQRALADAEKRLQDEAGAETAIVRLFETVSAPDGPSPGLPSRFASEYLTTIAWTPTRPAGAPITDEPIFVAVKTVFEEAWRGYRILLDGPFNGAEAVRRAASAVFTKALLAFAKDNPQPGASPSDRLIDIVGRADYPAMRLLDPAVPADPGAAGPTLDCFKSVRDVLVTIPWTDRLAVDCPPKLQACLGKSYNAALEPMRLLTVSDARFLPDHAPAPLPIQIAANIDGNEIDDFACHFNGIALAIRRIDTVDQTDRFAYASLAELSWPAPSEAGSPVPAGAAAVTQTKVPFAIHPMLPAGSDGRGPMFIEYEGMPLAATTFGNTAATPVETPEEHAPFYTSAAPDLIGKQFARIPRLAYGRAFQTFSFATTNAGTLPLALQDGLPWMPKAVFRAPVEDITLPEEDWVPDPKLVKTTPYQRRTAIGQMAVNETPVPNKPRRIGVPIDGVMPLSEDYPRTVLSAFTGAPGVCDLFRQRDGRGSLALSKGMEWRIEDTVFSGNPDRLAIRLLGGAATGPDDEGLGMAAVAKANFGEDLDFRHVSRLLIRLESVEAGDPPSRLTLICENADGLTLAQAPGLFISTPASDSQNGWIRLSLESTQGASLSLAVTETIKPYQPAAPLLLTADKNDAPKPAEDAAGKTPIVWKAGLTDGVEVVVDTPRVGYLDFERWFANADLRNAAFTKDEADCLQRALMTAYVLRDTDETLARALDRLPDPAVEAIRLELAVTDQLLVGALPASAQLVPFDIKSKVAPMMERILDHGEATWSPADLHSKLFDPIAATFNLTLQLRAGSLEIMDMPDKSMREKTKATDDKIKAGTLSAVRSPVRRLSVPSGYVARLSMDALVPVSHFEPLDAKPHPAVFHPGLMQHASRTIDGAKRYLAYPSAAISIETMLNRMYDIDTATDEKTGKPLIDKEPEKAAIRLAAEMIAVRPIENARRYDLQTRDVKSSKDPIRRNRWRLIGEIDVTTQRWRPSGRPIYNHIDPKQFFDDTLLADPMPAGGGSVAVPLAERIENDGHKPLFQFEAEAFFDRPNIDSQTVTQRLSPLPARTVLQQHHWDAPSATYFRHRFTLRSRYAGALNQVSACEVKAWIVNRKKGQTLAEAWTLRIAMLADLSRMLLTRPQQRALIPLTAAPRDDGKLALAPPVLAILQEPPFSRGGLADRIAAEIKTGFNYGFGEKATETEDAVETVGILDSRKEIGPDPRLTYRPFDQEAALGIVLNAEGPIGLTFDQVNAPAPAFPNSMFCLSPMSLTGGEHNLEEHFLGVSMRRYLDPNWTIEAGAPDASALDTERSWWITPQAATTGKLTYTVDGDTRTLLSWTENAGEMAVQARKAAIYGGVEETPDETVDVARWNRDEGGDISILHQFIAPGRYSASVFVLPKGTAPGQVKAPLPVCTIEWGPPTRPADVGGVRALPRPATLNANGCGVRAAMASAPTFLAWTRVGRNFDTVYTPGMSDGAPTLLPVAVRDLTARIKGNILNFDRSGYEKRCWLAPSTFLKPYPLHVQRHLAVLSSSYLQEPGRPVEEYCRSGLLAGRQASLAKADAVEHSLRIVEFETPAAILCGSGGSIPETYKRAYFDLLSTGFNADAGATARLSFRFSGSADHLKAFKKVTVRLFFDEKGEETDTIEVKFPTVPKPPEDLHYAALDLTIQKVSKKRPLYSGMLTRCDGELIPAPTILPPPDADANKAFGFETASAQKPGFFLEIEAGGGGEFWADVSLLHSSKPEFGSGFDFNWLFSKSGGSEPAADVSPSGLHVMVEAQARIVSVSPPIPLLQEKID